MIRNVIFDLGNVLIHFKPERFVERLGLADAADRELLRKVVFGGVDWTLMDWGALDEDGLEARVLPKLPERLHGAARALIHHWDEPIEPIPGMAELARDCKAAGLGVYVLSNASARAFDYGGNVPGSEYFDGAVVSAPLRCIKPMPEIYRHVLDTYGLRAEECLFVDDAAVNVSGAMLVGMRGCHFDGDAETARRAIFGPERG